MLKCFERYNSIYSDFLNIPPAASPQLNLNSCFLFSFFFLNYNWSSAFRFMLINRSVLLHIPTPTNTLLNIMPACGFH